MEIADNTLALFCSSGLRSRSFEISRGAAGRGFHLPLQAPSSKIWFGDLEKTTPRSRLVESFPLNFRAGTCFGVDASLLDFVGKAIRSFRVLASPVHARWQARKASDVLIFAEVDRQNKMVSGVDFIVRVPSGDEDVTLPDPIACMDSFGGLVARLQRVAGFSNG